MPVKKGEIMNTDIVQDYINYIENSLYQYFRILLGNDYEKKLVKPFIDKYIDVRYYNNTIYFKDNNFVDRISKEINIVAKESIKENMNNEENIKNICALFGYILYFDDCLKYKDVNSLVDTLFSDEIITISHEESIKQQFLQFINDNINKKKSFFKLFNTSDFEMVEHKLMKRVYREDINYTFEVSKMYSDYAKDKAFNTGTIAEDKMYVLYLMIVNSILKNAIDLDFSKYYIADFPPSLFVKTKKTMKYLKLMDNELVKDHFSVQISYDTYKNNRKIIDNYINMGYNFALEIDSSFDNDLSGLVLFQYILIRTDSKAYDLIMENANNIKSTIIRL
jgi:hypothetical protein